MASTYPKKPIKGPLGAQPTKKRELALGPGKLLPGDRKKIEKETKKKLIATTKAIVAKKQKIDRPDAPLSETLLEKDHTPRSAQACVQILQKMAKDEPERVITRNYFRVNSPIAESVWNAHFGTFEEFKRAAGIILTRQQHAHERKIAKHASVDHYRRLGAERSDWGEKYLRPSNRRFQIGMFCSDLHDKEIDPFFLRVWLDTVARVQPEKIGFVGDVLDLPEFGKYGVDPREWDPAGRIKFAIDNIWKPTRLAAPNAEIDEIEGNHEYRILRHFADATPALKTVLADLHGMDMRKLFKLDELEINWVGQADLACFTEADIKDELKRNYRVYWDAFLAYHYPDGRNMGMPGCNGHHHNHFVWSEFNKTYGSYEWHQMGAGHRRHASYTLGEKWSNGFLIVHCDTKKKLVNHEYIQITDMASVGGKLYVRDPSEIVSPCVPLATTR